MDDTTAADVARTEAARQAVILVFGVAGAFAIAVIGAKYQRAAFDPEFFRTHRMRAAKHAERFWARLAGWSWRQAERARVEYEAHRA